MSRQYRRKIQRTLQKLFRQRARRTVRRSGCLSSTLNFGRLEPRNLLASIGTELPVGTNLIVNGQFEQVVNEGPFHAADDVVGWNAVSSNGEQKINLFETVRTGNVLELDSTEIQFDRVFQDVDTVSGEQYVLSFDLRNRLTSDNADPFSNSVDVFWDNASVGILTADTQFHTIVLSVAGGAEDLTRLEFREIASGNDGVGPIIDNVRLVRATDGELGNGSFEIASGSGELLPATDVDSWKAGGRELAERNLRLVRDNDATDGSQYLNLETTPTHIDRVFQDLNTEAGSTYFVMFDLRGDASEVPASNELRVRWDNAWAGTFIGGDQWQSVGLLLNATTNTTRLVLRETGDGAGSGPLIDNVRIKRVTPILPAVNDLTVDLDPTSATNSTASFAEGSGPTAIVDFVDLTHASNDTLTSATVRIENLVNGGSEILAVDVGNTGLRATYDAAIGRLGITGEGSITDYERVLETLTYENTSDNPATVTRSISISVADSAISQGNNFSRRAFIDVAITAANDAPRIAPIANTAVSFGELFQYSVQATDDNTADLFYSLSTTGDVGVSAPKIDSDGQITWDVFAPSNDVEITVSVSDDQGATSQQVFTVTTQDFVPFSGQRQLSNLEPALRNIIYTSQPPMNIDTSKTYTAILKTDVGDIEILLYDDLTPITVNNFVNLAQDGFYDGVTFHRVISGFVAQGGDPLGTGTGGPGYRFDDEIVAELVFDGRGLLAMANSGPGTNGSQFFITYAAQPHLNGDHTIFGELVNGNTALDAIVLTNSGLPATVINSIEIVVT